MDCCAKTFRHHMLLSMWRYVRTWNDLDGGVFVSFSGLSTAVNMCAYFRHPISILVYVFIWLRGLHSSSAYSRHLSKISVLGQFETFYGTFLVLINPEIVSVALISRLEI